MEITWSSLFMGQHLMVYERLDSTNAEAERLQASKKLPEGSLVLAKEQYAGRGQRGNHWHSQAGKNLTVTFVLYPKLPPMRQFVLNQVASLAVADTLVALGVQEVRVKWPNDILVRGRKIAGILIQNAVTSRGISHCIMGIGLNVNQVDFPKGTPFPTSIFKATGKPYPVPEVLALLCPALERRYLQMSSGASDDLKAAYHQLLYQMRTPHLYRRATGEEFIGTILGVSEQGLLTVRTKEGVEDFYFKEIVFV
jgi:BirA family biotin operon repressor/biotin-[acetyl-CoA-carboxylase] ligase